MTAPPPATPAAPAADGSGVADLVALIAGAGLGEQASKEWLTVLDAAMPLRSGALSVAEAAPLVQAYKKKVTIPAEWSPYAAQALADAGVGLADTLSLLRVRDMRWCLVPEAADVVAGALRSMARHYPDMGVRNALGWALQEAAAGSAPLSLPGWVRPRVDPWARRGLAEAGWLYAAAGLTPRETRAALDAGTLTDEDARAMVALRGMPLPA